MNILKKSAVLFTVIAVLYGVAAFSLPGSAKQADGRNDPHSLWMKSVIMKREKKNKEYKSSATSPMAAVQRLTVDGKTGNTVFVLEENRKISLSPKEGRSAIFTLSFKDSRWSWKSRADSITCSADQKPIPSGSALVPGALIQGGQTVIKTYPSKKKLILLVFNPRRPLLLKFSGLLYFAPAKKYAVQATLEKYPDPKTVTMGTSRNLKKTYYRYARIRFKLDGKELQLTALKAKLKGPYSDHLFIPFGDTTNGNGTYGAGRFLEIPEPKGSQFTLDFNLCFNPLCNYSPAYNCPLPPRENILAVPINAGEKEYPH